MPAPLPQHPNRYDEDTAFPGPQQHCLRRLTAERVGCLVRPAGDRGAYGADLRPSGRGHRHRRRGRDQFFGVRSLAGCDPFDQFAAVAFGEQMQFGGQAAAGSAEPLRCPGLAGLSPLYELRQRADGHARCRVGLRPPVETTDSVRVGLQPAARSATRSRPAPTGRTGDRPSSRPVTIRDLMPLRTVLGPPQDPVDYLPVITPTSTTLRRHRGQQRCQPRPLPISQISSHDSTTIDHGHA